MSDHPGGKPVSLGEHYDASRYLLVSVDLPLVGDVIEASLGIPYFCCKIDLDLASLADLLVDECGKAPRHDLSVLAVYPGDPDLIDAACRLVGLLARLHDIAVLAPLAERDILYRLLTGPHGPLLRHMASADSRLNQTTAPSPRSARGFQTQLRIDEIAVSAGMSPSSLHQHFKAITRMTPLEYQKQLRLQEARRLMLAGGVSAGLAGFAVGYDSPSQFSREYRRLFGAPPRQDIARLQAAQDYVGAV